jgi:release factor glutamine methyltransferase
MEHADTQQETLLSWLRAGPWAEVTGHRDLADRPRFVTAVRVGDFGT